MEGSVSEFAYLFLFESLGLSPLCPPILKPDLKRQEENSLGPAALYSTIILSPKTPEGPEFRPQRKIVNQNIPRFEMSSPTPEN